MAVQINPKLLEVLRRQAKNLARNLKKEVYIVILPCGSEDIVLKLQKKYKLIETIKAYD